MSRMMRLKMITDWEETEPYAASHRNVPTLLEAARAKEYLRMESRFEWRDGDVWKPVPVDENGVFQLNKKDELVMHIEIQNQPKSVAPIEVAIAWWRPVGSDPTKPPGKTSPLSEPVTRHLLSGHKKFEPAGDFLFSLADDGPARWPVKFKVEEGNFAYATEIGAGVEEISKLFKGDPEMYVGDG